MAEWHDGYAEAMEHTSDALDRLGVPREANGAKLYIHERIGALHHRAVRVIARLLALHEGQSANDAKAEAERLLLAAASNGNRRTPADSAAGGIGKAAMTAGTEGVKALPTVRIDKVGALDVRLQRVANAYLIGLRNLGLMDENTDGVALPDGGQQG